MVELDKLIDELLLASRLQMTEDLDAADPIDLLALTAEEGALTILMAMARSRRSAVWCCNSSTLHPDLRMRK